MKTIELTDAQFDYLIEIIEKSINRTKRKLNDSERALHDPYLPINEDIEKNIKENIEKYQQKIIDKTAIIASMLKNNIEKSE